VAVVDGVLVVPVVGVAVGAVVGVVPLPVLVELPPQAARRTTALSATRQNKTGFICFFVFESLKVVVLFNCIFFLLSERYYITSIATIYYIYETKLLP
jgi:hypothetical protein